MGAEELRGKAQNKTFKVTSARLRCNYIIKTVIVMIDWMISNLSMDA
jgi:hypothetical protein